MSLFPRPVLDGIARVLRHDGRVFICDGRRDIGVPGALLYYLLSAAFSLDRTVPGRVMRRYWRSSIQAGYTPSELRAVLAGSALAGWRVESSRMDVLIRV